MKLFAIKREDESIVLIHSDSVPNEHIGENDELIGEVLNKDLPDRSYFNCFTDNGSGGVKIDLPKARIQKEDEIRTERDRQLVLTDAAFMIALSKGDPTTDIEADKTILRDMMSDVTSGLSGKMAATTIDAFDGFADITLAGVYE